MVDKACCRYWKRSDGTPYARVLENEAGRLLLATNAGMFDPALNRLPLSHQIAPCLNPNIG